MKLARLEQMFATVAKLQQDADKLAKRAKGIAKSLGYRSAAGFLRNRDVAFEDAYVMLFGVKPRVC